MAIAEDRLTEFPSVGELEVADALGVSPVGWDTRLLASQAVEVGTEPILDLGTGTGFVAIYLKLRGFDVEGVDINPRALRCARENAGLQGVDVRFRLSDLFENLERRYGLIVFNPPYGNAGSARSTRWLEIVKSMLPKENPLVSRIAYRWIRRPRIRLIQRFLNGCGDHLDEGGRVLLLLQESEVSLTSQFSTALIASRREFRLLLLEPVAKPEIGSEETDS